MRGAGGWECRYCCCWRSFLVAVDPDAAVWRRDGGVGRSRAVGWGVRGGEGGADTFFASMQV